MGDVVGLDLECGEHRWLTSVKARIDLGGHRSQPEQHRDVNSQSVGHTLRNVQVESRMAVAALQAPDPPFGATGKVRQLALREAAQAPEPPDAQAKLACVHLRSSVASSLISARGARRQSQVISGN